MAKAMTKSEIAGKLAEEVGISKSKGLAILNTLKSSGLVTRDERTKNYGLGSNLLPLGRALINNTDLAKAASCSSIRGTTMDCAFSM